MEDPNAKKREAEAGTRTLEEIAIYQAKRWEDLKKTSKLVDAPEKSGLKAQCRIWTGYVTKASYGLTSYRGLKLLVHRVSYMIHEGSETIAKKNKDGDMLVIRHLCNVSLCFEPTHLKLGTTLENGQDMAENGKKRGENHHNAKITEEIARLVKMSKPTGLSKLDPAYETQKQRATRFNLSRSAISNIDNGYAWTHIPDSNGLTDQTKANASKKTVRASKKRRKETPWTEEECEQVKQKLLDPAYVLQHSTRSHDGVPCREWLGGKSSHGYGIMSIHGGVIMAHIAAAIIGNNNMRPEKLDATHKCGFALCVEPRHVRFATRIDNMKDKVEHGTSGAKVSAAQVKEIYELYAIGDITQASLAQTYKVSPQTISRVMKKYKKTVAGI